MLIDTDVLIWYLRGHEKARLFLQKAGTYTISAVTYMELIQGMRNATELSALRRFLRQNRVPVLPISEAVSGRAMVYMEDHFLSHSLELADALIAAAAVDCGETLATGNTKHYRVITELELVPFSPVDA